MAPYRFAQAANSGMQKITHLPLDNPCLSYTAVSVIFSDNGFGYDIYSTSAFYVQRSSRSKHFLWYIYHSTESG